MTEYEERVLEPLMKMGEEKDGDIKEIEGILKELKPSPIYENNTLFVLETKDKELVTIAGTTAMQGSLKEEDIGKKVKFVYKGMKMGKNNLKYKDISIFVSKE